MQKVLNRVDVTNTKLAAVTETLEAEIDGLQRRELELKKMWVLVKQANDVHGVDLMRNELGELIIEVKMYKSRWENTLDTRLKEKLREVEAAVETMNEETKGDDDDGTFPSSGVMLKQVATPSFQATRRSIGRVLSLRTEDDFAGPDASLGLASKRIHTLELLAGLVEPGGTERFQSAVFADQGRKTSHANSGAPGLFSAASFSTQLYQTVNKRVSEVQDVGKELEVSRVRGDGRCLFRSVARGQHYLRTSGLRDWNEKKERTEADRLRGKVVEELRKHRQLLVSFCVVDGEFNRYCQIMSDPKTFGGEPELLMLALIVHTPISVYLSSRSGFSQIQVYGRQYTTNPINILYKDGIHYDALLSKKGRER
uniref:Ubiquitin thioesterase OTU n=1 Tax=Rhodosorus marinus TaxID=101924 RepID=A0A7S0BRY3_9RHOD|mmetsp:Transcript_5900/g.8339  ORF Transcript_5900/g.8339 Transcript_5900/m.8339 type:complete len:369 (+) Transcript_5900:723-1829(+)